MGLPLSLYKGLGAEVVVALCQKETPLTGYQVKFIREYFDLSLRDFANIFGLSHPAVLKWEKYGDDFAQISPSTEKMLRLDAIFRLGTKAKDFYQIYTSLNGLEGKLHRSEAVREEPLKLAI